MEQYYRGPVLQGELRVVKVLNQKEDRGLQRKLNMLDKQYSYTRKMLRQRRDWLMAEERRVMMVKSCEPKATLNVALNGIREHKLAESHFRRSVHTSAAKLPSSKSQYHN